MRFRLLTVVERNYKHGKGGLGCRMWYYIKIGGTNMDLQFLTDVWITGECILGCVCVCVCVCVSVSVSVSVSLCVCV
jgi:hypothetical protein